MVKIDGNSHEEPVQRSHYGHCCDQGRNVSGFLYPMLAGWESAGSIPPDEVLEQLVALGLGDWARSSGRNLPLRQELIELIAPAGETLLAMVLEPSSAPSKRFSPE
jgi:hypothetical protein